MFRNLIPALADRYHVIAPDYPGFGESAAPDHKTFAYTFGHYADIVDGLLTQLGVKDYAIYLMDYGAPVGYRLALKHPERVTALIVQNGNAYEEGLKAFWDPIKAYWADGSEAHRAAIGVLVAPETTKFQYTDGVADVSRIDPDNWGHDQPLLDRPGNKDIQLDLFLDYGTNVPLYPKFQAFFRERKPPTLIVWGKNDKIFPADGATPYLRDLPDAELHLLDTGHFALEDKLDEMVPLIRDFLCRKLVPHSTPRLPTISFRSLARDGLRTNAGLQTARDVRGPVAVIPLASEPPANIIVDPPLPDALARGLVVIQYRTENLRIVPVFGSGRSTSSPRVGHLHLTVDDGPWHWVDASGEPLIIQSLTPGPHRVLIELADPTHRVDRPGCRQRGHPGKTIASRRPSRAPSLRRKEITFDGTKFGPDTSVHRRAVAGNRLAPSSNAAVCGRGSNQDFRTLPGRSLSRAELHPRKIGRDRAGDRTSGDQ